MSLVAAFLVVAGAFFGLIAAVGVLRFPDFYIRMHAATKAGAFGATLLLLGAAVHFGSIRASLMALFIIGFFYLTTPIAAQTLGEAAYRRGVPLWRKTVIDRLAGEDRVRDGEKD